MYRGRFAPSPTGPLHFGSLVAATASFLAARSRNGIWLLRMEDIDLPRCRSEHAFSIITTLAQFGFRWDEPILYQSVRFHHYQQALDQLCLHTYPCTCSRKALAPVGLDGVEPRYPGTCRSGRSHPTRPAAWRIRVPEAPITFTDRLQGTHTVSLAESPGDFVLLRADGIWSYQLAVVVDDAFQGITEVVRGMDLITSCARQIFLFEQLAAKAPSWLHVPVATGPEGQKLSKQNLAPGIDPLQASQELHNALRFLGQAPPAALASAPIPAIWEWALANWNESLIPRGPALPARWFDS